MSFKDKVVTGAKPVVGKVVGNIYGKVGETIEELWQVRAGANGEEYFDVLDDSGDVTLGYDFSTSTYGGANTIETRQNKPAVIVCCNIYSRQYGTFNFYSPNVASSTTLYRSYMETYSGGNQATACWALIRSLD